MHIDVSLILLKKPSIFIFSLSLTKREREERQYKKQLLNIAKEHEKARELERIQRYHMPQDLKKGEKCK